LWRLVAVRHAKDAERHGGIDLGEVLVIELLPFVTGLVIIWKLVADRKGGGRNARVGEVALSLRPKNESLLSGADRLYAGFDAGFGEGGSDIGVSKPVRLN
jgi:hypothetical protein